MNTEKIKTLQANILQWAQMQNDLLNAYMSGDINKDEYKGRYNNLDEDIQSFKKEIYELTK